MQRGDVDQMNFVSLSGKPAGILAGPAADIKEKSRRRREKLREELERALPFQLAGADLQPVGFIAGTVVCTHGFRAYSTRALL